MPNYYKLVDFGTRENRIYQIMSFLSIKDLSITGFLSSRTTDQQPFIRIMGGCPMTGNCVGHGCAWFT